MSSFPSKIIWISLEPGKWQVLKISCNWLFQVSEVARLLLERADDRKRGAMTRDKSSMPGVQMFILFISSWSDPEVVQIGGTVYTTLQSSSDITASKSTLRDPMVVLTESLRQVAASWIAGVVYTEEWSSLLACLLRMAAMRMRKWRRSRPRRSPCGASLGPHGGVADLRVWSKNQKRLYLFLYSVACLRAVNLALQS